MHRTTALSDTRSGLHWHRSSCDSIKWDRDNGDNNHRYNDHERYNFEMVCSDGHTVPATFFDENGGAWNHKRSYGSDVDDWASPNGEDTIECAGEANYATGIKTVHYLTDDSDNVDVYDFELVCADGSRVSTNPEEMEAA